MKNLKFIFLCFTLISVSVCAQTTKTITSKEKINVEVCKKCKNYGKKDACKEARTKTFTCPQLKTAKSSKKVKKVIRKSDR